MTIYFSEIFKTHRKEKNLTQEQMAEILGVSPQAISRWETGSTYPDITLLPVISDFFEILVDDLLGVGKAKIQGRIDNYISQFQSAISKGAINDCIEIMRTALLEFPNHYLLLSQLMYALYVASEDDELAARYDEEIIAIGERILNYCHDDDIRMEAKRLLLRHYCDTGNKTKALHLVNTLPEENASKETNLYWVLEGNERNAYLKERICSYTSSLTWAIWALATHTPDLEFKLMALHTLQKIEDVVYEASDYGEQFYSRALMSATLSQLYLQKGSLHEAISHADAAVTAAISYHTLPPLMSYTAPLLEGMLFDKVNVDTNDTRNLCEQIYNDYFSNTSFDEIRKISSIETLRQYF